MSESNVYVSSSRFWRIAGRVLLVLLLLGSARRGHADDLEQWLQSEGLVARTKLTNNILPNGAVVAAPSRQNPDYYYHWIRDAALTMKSVYALYTGSSVPADRDLYGNDLINYVTFSRGNQTTVNPRSAPGRGLGEPKFNTDGSAFTGNWGRPQDDGPALRALVLTRLAQAFLDGGQAGQVAFVKSKLYDSALPTSSVIKSDLEYISHNWQNKCFDPWEEVNGYHFYTRMVQRKALLEGAKLANRLNDAGAAGWYTGQASALESEIAKHWDPNRGYIVVTLDPDDPSFKPSGLDTAVVLGVLHAQTQDDEFLSATNDMVLATAQQLATRFQSLYTINQRISDNTGARLGIAIGRYPEDRYNGTSTDGQGNPWVLCTNAMAELYYRAASDWTRKGQVVLTERNIAFFRFLDSTQFVSLQPQQVLTQTDPEFLNVLSVLRMAGDQQLRRTKFHANADGSLSEQINRETGFMQSAYDLTWNYASILTVLAQRARAAPSVAPDRLLRLDDSRRARARFDPSVLQAADEAIAPATDLAGRVSKLEKTVEALLRQIQELPTRMHPDLPDATRSSPLRPGTRNGRSK